MTEREKRVDPLLKWVGGKRLLGPWIAEQVGKLAPDFYCEPFLGSGASALAVFHELAYAGPSSKGLQAAAEWIVAGDSSRFVGTWWSAIHNAAVDHGAFAVTGAIHGLPPRTEWRYYRARKAFNDEARVDRMTPLQVIGLLYYLNKSGYNGLCRFNRSGGYNVPWGHHTHGSHVPQVNVGQVATHTVMAAGMDFARRPWRVTLNRFRTRLEGRRPGEDRRTGVLYADPPFLGTFTGYGGQKWVQEDLETFLQALDELPPSVTVLISEHAQGPALAVLDAYGYEAVHHWDRSGVISAGERKPTTEAVYRRRRRE